MAACTATSADAVLPVGFMNSRFGQNLADLHGRSWHGRRSGDGMALPLVALRPPRESCLVEECCTPRPGVCGARPSQVDPDPCTSVPEHDGCCRHRPFRGRRPCRERGHCASRARSRRASACRQTKYHEASLSGEPCHGMTVVTVSSLSVVTVAGAALEREALIVVDVDVESVVHSAVDSDLAQTLEPQPCTRT